MRRFSTAVSIGLLLVTAVAKAQSLAITETDRAFLREQAQDTGYELAIAKLAEQKAVQPDIKQYAAMIVHDHDELNKQLAELAAFKSVDLPTDMKSRAQARLARLQGLEGEAFDSAYIEETTRINKEDERDDQRELAATADPAVKTFVQTLQASDAKHYEMGKQLHAG